MTSNINLYQGDLVVEPKNKIGLVTSRFNNAVTEKLEMGALERLMELGVPSSQIIQVRVPGALEIPLATRALFEEMKCDGVIVLGAVIRGETSHYDSVCLGVERGCSALALEYGKPVGFGILTTEDVQQAKERVGGAKGHKGKEAVDVVIELLSLLKGLKS